MSNSYISPSLDHRDLDLSQIDGIALGLNITNSVNEFIEKYGEEALTAANIMGFVQRAWRLNKDRASNARLIFAYYRTEEKRRKIIGVFTSGRDNKDDQIIGEDNSEVVSKLDQFVKSDEDHRYIFLAEPCEPSEWNKYINRYLPSPKKGEANPVRYYNEPE